MYIVGESGHKGHQGADLSLDKSAEAMWVIMPQFRFDTFCQLVGLLVSLFTNTGMDPLVQMCFLPRNSSPLLPCFPFPNGRLIPT